MPKFSGDDGIYAQFTALVRNAILGPIKDPGEAQPENQTKWAYLEDVVKFGAFASKVRTVTAAGTVTLADVDPIFIEIDPNGSDRDVSLPAKGATNHGYLIRHVGSANVLSVKRSGGTVIATISAGETKYINPSVISDFVALTIGITSSVINNYLTGLTLSNNGSDATNDIDIAAGYCADSTNAVMMTGAALTKRLDAAWAVGTNQGGLDTGSIANATYHVWLIKRSDTGVVDALFSTSATAPTMPASYDYKRRIGSIVRTGAAIKAFIQDGDDFMWSTPVVDVNAAANPGTSAVTRTLTVPVGVRVKSLLNVIGYNVGAAATPNNIYISDLSLADVAPAATAVASVTAYTTATGDFALGAQVSCFTNTSAQVRSRLQQSAANTQLFIITNGWIDTRGR
jgi:hypothetical protein